MTVWKIRSSLRPILVHFGKESLNSNSVPLSNEEVGSSPFKVTFSTLTYNMAKGHAKGCNESGW